MFPKLTRSADRAPRSARHERATHAGEVAGRTGRAPPTQFFVVLAGSLEVVLPGLHGDDLHHCRCTPGDSPARSARCAAVAGLVRACACATAARCSSIDDAQLRAHRADRRRAQRAVHARLHPAPHRPDRVRAQATSVLLGSRHSADTLRLQEFLTRNAHPVRQHRRRQRSRTCRRCSIGSTSAVERHAGGDLPRRARAQEPEHRERRRVPRHEPGARRQRACTTWSSSAPGRPGSRPRSTPPRKGSTCSCSRRSRPAARPARARGSRTTWASRPASPARRSPGARSSQAQKFGAERQRRRAARCGCTATAGRTRSSLPTAASVLAPRRRDRERARSTASSTLDEPRALQGSASTTPRPHLEAKLCDGEEIVVVGGGNSAGQAAVFLAQPLPPRPHPGALRGPGREHVALPDPPHRGEPEHHAARAHPDHRARRRATGSSASPGAAPAGRRPSGTTSRTSS